MLRIWCNWKKVSVSSSDAGIEKKMREEEEWGYGEEMRRGYDQYWKVNSMTLVPSQDHKQVSRPNTCVFH
ncbi:hypothetical protein U1Q18_036511 [Sarracenia purpurea var. burkii]